MNAPLKPIDLTAAALGMAVRAAGSEWDSALEALTCRWAVVAPLDDPLRWLAPAVGAWDGICAGLCLASVGARSLADPGSDPGRLAAALALADRPLVVGPVAAFGHGPDLHIGEVAFLVFLGRESHDVCHVCDPRGWPGLRIGVARLADMIAAAGGGILAIDTAGGGPTRPSPNRVAAQAARLARGNGAEGSAALVALARTLAVHPPGGRAARALAVGLPLFAGRRFHLAAFMADGGAPPGLVAALDAQVVAAGHAGAALADNDGQGLVSWLSTMAEAEVEVELAMAALAA